MLDTNSKGASLQSKIWGCVPAVSAAFWCLLPKKFIQQRLSRIELLERLGHRRRMHGYGTVCCAVVDVIADKRFDVPVENQPNDVRVAIHHRRSRVAPDNVIVRDEVKRRGQVQL